MAKRRGEGGGMVFSTNTDLMDRLLVAPVVETLSPEQQPLVVRRDNKGRKGKVVTLVEGFVGKEKDLQELGKRLKVACGTGGSAKEGEIIIQGEVVSRVVELLRQWGYSKCKAR